MDNVWPDVNPRASYYDMRFDDFIDSIWESLSFRLIVKTEGLVWAAFFLFLLLQPSVPNSIKRLGNVQKHTCTILIFSQKRPDYEINWYCAAVNSRWTKISLIFEVTEMARLEYYYCTTFFRYNEGRRWGSHYL